MLALRKVWSTSSATPDTEEVKSLSNALFEALDRLDTKPRQQAFSTNSNERLYAVVCGRQPSASDTNSIAAKWPKIFSWVLKPSDTNSIDVARLKRDYLAWLAKAAALKEAANADFSAPNSPAVGA